MTRMHSSYRTSRRRVLFALGGTLGVGIALLTACGGGTVPAAGTAAPAAAPTTAPAAPTTAAVLTTAAAAAPTTAPSPTASAAAPTTAGAAAAPTTAPVTAGANLTTYTGNGFSIGYPAGWAIEKASPSAASVIFVDPTHTIQFIVTVTPNPNANSATSVALDPLLHSMQSKPHYQQVDIAPTTTVGGETWDQIGAIGDLPYSGQTLSIKVIALAVNRPAHDANTVMYKIQFSAPAKDFGQMDSATFQPMLQSFRFA